MDAANQGYTADSQVIWHGVVMILLGLFSAITTAFTKAPVAALQGHLIGMLQGTLLLAMAAIWPSLSASSPVLNVAKWCALIGFYGNWMGTQLAAFWGARAMFTVNSARIPAGAAPWMEVTVAVLLLLSVLVIVTCGVILWAVREPAH